MTGIILSLLSAAAFGANSIVTRRGLIRLSARNGVFVTVMLGIPLFMLAALATGELFKFDRISAFGYGMLAAAGVVHFLFGRYCTFRAINAIGANRTMPIQATSGFYSVIVAVIFLGEKVDVITGIGIVLLLLGPGLVAEGGRRESRREGSPALRGDLQSHHKEAAPATRLAEGYLFGFLSAVAYGTSPIFIRAALDDAGGLAVLGGLVSYLAAGAVMAVGMVVTRDWGKQWSALRAERRSSRWFVLAAVGVFFAQFFRYLALAVAPVTVVVPLSHTRPVFTVLFSWGFNRHLESFAPGTLAGIVLSMAGAVVVSYGGG
jgi:drug/metabolite transporter (DMT)-like permease